MVLSSSFELKPTYRLTQGLIVAYWSRTVHGVPQPYLVLYRRIGKILLLESMLVIVVGDPLRLGKLQGILHTNAAEDTTLSSLDAMLDGQH